MIGRCTHLVDCRETRGLGEGGGIAQRGTFAECGSDVLAVAMSPGRRHITKPVCEITFGLREANLLTSTMILDAGSGVPHDAPAGGAGQAVTSPLPGVILEVCVKEGDAVKRGQTVMVLEAMKMENAIEATADGTVTAIKVGKGDSVLEGAPLVIIG